MAYAMQARFCGRCGAPLAPGAGFCGRCGTPIAAQVVAVQPVYRYAPAPPAAYPTSTQYRLAPAMIAGGLILVLIVAAVIVGGVALSRFAGNAHSPCTLNCGPKIARPLPEEASFKSSAYGFQVNYSSTWTVRSHDSTSITLGTRVGLVEVTGARDVTPEQAIQRTVSGLPSSTWQDVTLVGNLRGAHLADQDGIGAVYSANLVGTSQTAAKVRFAVIAANRAGVTVVVFATDPADLKNSPNGIPEGQAFDYLCTEFAWQP